MTQPVPSTLTVRVPLAFRRRGGRKLVVAPDGAAWARSRPRVDSAMVKALARSFRWKRMLESGRFGTAFGTIPAIGGAIRDRQGRPDIRLRIDGLTGALSRSLRWIRERRYDPPSSLDALGPGAVRDQEARRSGQGRASTKLW